MKGASRMIYKRLLSPLLVCALIQAAMGRQSGSETAAPGDFTLTDHHFNGEHLVILHDGTELKLSRSRKEWLEQRLGTGSH